MPAKSTKKTQQTKRPLEERVKARKSPWAKGIIALTVAAGCYACANTYANRQLDARQARYLELADNPPTRDIVSHEANALSKIQYLREISAQEELFERRMPELISYLKREQPLLEQLTASEEERYGVIDYENGAFRITTTDDWFRTTRLHFKEIARGDLTHKQEVLAFAEKYPEILNEQMRQALPILLSTIEAKQQYERLTPEERRKVRIGLVTPDGTKEEWSYEKVQTTAAGAQNLFALLHKQLQSTSPQLVSISTQRKYSRFHTHPKEDREYSPSPGDKANTQFMGPTVLLSQTEGMIHIYAINRGMSREIITIPLRAKEPLNDTGSAQ